MKSICILLLVIGLGCFFAPMIVHLKPEILPNSVEWPMGYSEHVISTQSRLHIVPDPSSGRIQIYNPDWQFMRGWNIAACNFKLMPFDELNQQMEVFGCTQKNGSVLRSKASHCDICRKYRFDMNGRLLLQESYPLTSYKSLPEPGESLWVPTHFWLLPLSSPVYGWIIGAIGMIGLKLLKRNKSR